MNHTTPVLDAQTPEHLAGVLVDTGTMKRIPMAFKANLETGEWAAHKPAPNGIDILVDDDYRPIVVRGKAVGKLQLLPVAAAEQFGLDLTPQQKIKAGEVETLSEAEKKDGLDQYKRVYFNVWNGFRGEAKRCVQSRWQEMLAKSSLFDSFVIRHRN